MLTHDALTTYVADRQAARLRDAEASRTARLLRRARRAVVPARPSATPVVAPTAPAPAPAVTPTFLVASPGSTNTPPVRDAA